jgi:hypothetical protein
MAPHNSINLFRHGMVNMLYGPAEMVRVKRPSSGVAPAPPATAARGGEVYARSASSVIIVHTSDFVIHRLDINESREPWVTRAPSYV